MTDSQNKKRVGFVFFQENFWKHYANSEVLTDLSEVFDLKIFISDKINHSMKYSNVLNCQKYSSNPMNNKKYQLLNDHLAWINRNKSTSIAYRRFRKNGFVFPDRSQSKIKTCVQLSRRVGWWIFQHYRFVLTNKFVSRTYLLWLTKNLSQNSSLKQLIVASNLEVIVCPVSVHDNDAFDLLSITEELNIKTLFIADNWDNVSSKTVYWKKPSYIAVWGEQSKEHAIRIQNFKSDQVFVLGSARHSTFFKYRLQKLETPFPFPYILFCGTALFFDEEKYLKFIDHILDANHKLFGDTKIVYRPHPDRQHRKITSYQVLPSRVILDPRTLRSQKITPNLENVQISDPYDIALLTNSRVVVGGFTSMIIEASILFKHFLAIAIEEKGSFSSPHLVLKNYEHLQGLHGLRTLQIARTFRDLEEKLICLVRDTPQIEREIADNERNFFLFDNAEGFSARLVKCLENL